MTIKELLEIDKFYCVTTFSNEERLDNIISLGKDLNIEIELFQAKKDDEPRMSFNRTMLEILNKSKKLNQKIIIFEDDVNTELSNLSMLNKILESNIQSYSYDVLSLGSICYKKSKINDYLYQAESFGYTHAVVYDLRSITDQFLIDLENNLIVNKMVYDSGLSITCQSHKKALTFKESLFTQKNFESISGGVSELYNKSCLYKSKSEITCDFDVTSVQRYKLTDERNYLYQHFKLQDVSSFRFDITKKTDQSFGGNLITQFTDVDSGIIFNRLNAYDEPYWVVTESPVDIIMIEILSGKKCLFRKVIDLTQY